MKPTEFEEQEDTLVRPDSMTDDECGPLPIFRTDDDYIISCWQASFKDRLKFLFVGKMWLGIMTGKSQPPVWLDTKRPFTTRKYTHKS